MMKVTLEKENGSKTYILDPQREAAFLKALMMVLGGASEHEILDRRDYFAVKLWSDEDIRSCLADRQFAPSDENVRKVMATGYLGVLDDCTDDEWNVIYDAIGEEAEHLERMYPPMESMIRILDSTVRFEEQDCTDPEYALAELLEMGFTEGLLKSLGFDGPEGWGPEPEPLEDLPKEDAFSLLGSIVQWFYDDCMYREDARSELQEIGFPDEIISAFSDD